MALIHEELYRSKGADSLDFFAYLQKLTEELFRSYNLRKEDISLKMELEQAYLGMDTAIPLGIIVNELVSNSLKHAFPRGEKGQISLNLKSVENPSRKMEDPESGPECNVKGSFRYLLRVSDNGKGIEGGISFQESETLGFQLVNLLVEQIDGCIELKKDKGAEFTIWFNNIEK
jgi:two-component sensor histidine kinase